MAFGKVLPVIGLNLGFVGNFSRTGERVITARQVLPSTPNPIKFGDAVVIVPDSMGGTYQSVADFITGGGNMTPQRFAGVANREVKTSYTYPLQPGQEVIGSYVPGEIAEAGERGSVVVFCNNGSPQTQSPVYLRIAANQAIPAGVVGGFEAVADGANTIDLSTVGVVWRTGVVDANGAAELTMRHRVAA